MASQNDPMYNVSISQSVLKKKVIGKLYALVF